MIGPVYLWNNLLSHIKAAQSLSHFENAEKNLFIFTCFILAFYCANTDTFTSIIFFYLMIFVFLNWGLYIYNWGLWFLLRISVYIYCRLTHRYVLCIFCVACIALLDLWWRLTSLTLTSYCSNTRERVKNSELLTHISLCISCYLSVVLPWN